MSPIFCISLITDFGVDSEHAGICRAVALSLAPDVPLLEVTHGIRAFDVRAGALALERSMRYVPVGVHVAVVDPGVGSSRRRVALHAGERTFVGPDNGLLLFAAESCGEIRAVELTSDQFFLPRRGVTFDGRDVFLPIAAQLARGADISDVGSPIDPETLVRIERPVARVVTPGRLETEVIAIDAFGNVQLAATSEHLRALGLEIGEDVRVGIFGAVVGESFSGVDEGEFVLYVDSDEQLALAVRHGDAAARLEVGVDDVLLLDVVSS